MHITISFNKNIESEKLLKIESLAMINSFPEPEKKCIRLYIENLNFSAAGWQSVIPIKSNHFDMNPNEFKTEWD